MRDDIQTLIPGHETSVILNLGLKLLFAVKRILSLDN